MEKPVFLRLPVAKRQSILEKGKAVYIQYPYEDITIRFLTERMGMDVTTFYRYFDNKDDFLTYAYRELIERTRYEDYALVYRFVNVYDNELDNAFFAACMNIAARNRPIRDLSLIHI